jgi:ketosteroid isomerase-like protein
MSRGNVEVVRRLNEALNERGAQGLDEVWDDSFASDAEIRDRANAPDQAEDLSAKDAMLSALGLWVAAFDELRADIDEYMDRDEFVICEVRWRGTAKDTGLALDMRMFDVWELRDGVIVKGTMGFRSKEEALEAAGLSE